MKYNGSEIICYDDILKMMKNGVVGEAKKIPELFKFAHNRGNYIGAPGKELYFSLNNLTDLEINDIAFKLASLFPVKPPGNHVKWAACIRYICGCFEKQGCLRSSKDKMRMIGEKQEWEKSFKFLDILKSKFKDSGNSYGIVILDEMIAHRYGDLSIIYPNEKDKYLEKMEHYYNNAQKIGVIIKSWKHTFTPFYWAACYFYELSYKAKAIEYHKKNLKMMNRYCPDARPGYREKARQSIKQLKDLMGIDFNIWFKRFKMSIVNKCLKKSVL